MPMRSIAAHRQPIWREGALVLGIVVVAAALRFWALDGVPPGYHYDEAFEGLEAWRVLTQPQYHPVFFSGNFGVEPLFIYLTSLAFRLFGAGPTTQRAVAALLGTLAVPALYALAVEVRSLDGRLSRAFPLLSAGTLAIMYWHIHFSRVGIEPVLVPLLYCLGFWGFLRGLRTGRLWPFLVAGVSLGLGPYAYPAGRLLLPLAAVLVAAIMLLDWAWLRPHLRGLGLALLVALAIIVPLALHFVRNPQLLTLRGSQVAVGGGGQGSLWANVLGTLGMFSFAGDANPRSNLPGRPALDWFVAGPFYLGVGLSIWRLASRGRRPGPSGQGNTNEGISSRAARSGACLLLLSLVVLLLPTALSEHAPHFRRAIGATVPVAMLVSLGLSNVAKWAGAWATKTGCRGMMPAGLAPALVLALVLGGSAVVTVRDYFHRWAGSPDLYYAFDVGLWEIGGYVNALPSDELVYVSPRPASDTTLAFAWRNGQSPRHFDGRSAFVTSAPDGAPGRPATYVIVGHEDFRGSLLLRELYPQARRVQRFLDRDGRVYAEAFRVEPGETLSRGPREERAASWNGIRLEGYDLTQSRYDPGDTVYLQLWWVCEAEISRDWTVFTHVLGPARTDGSVVSAGHDAQPGQGSVPTSTWQGGELILDEHQLLLPQDMPAGRYTLEIGLYDGSTGERALTSVSPLGDPDAPAEQWEKTDHVVLGSLEIEQGRD